jgi:hypothetical protein
MSYRVTHLWAILDEQERSLRWLARKTGYTHQYLSLLKTARRTGVSDDFATRVARALNLPVEAAFAPADREQVA